MPTPIRPLPTAVARWITRLRWLRAVDAAVAGLVVLLALRVWAPRLSGQSALILTLALIVGMGLIARLRVACRPVSAAITLAVSRRLRPGDRAWFVHGTDADLVLVTARHGLRMVIARPGHDAAEGIRVRRTRVLLIPQSSL